MFKSYTLQVCYSIAQLLGWSFVIFYLVVNGFTKLEIVIYFTTVYLTAYITTYFMEGLELRKAIIYSLFLRIISFLLLARFFFRSQLYLVAVAWGMFIPLFWIPQRINYYNHSKKHNTATLAGLFNSIEPLLSLLLPVLGGLTIKYFGYNILFLIAVIILIITLIPASHQKPRSVCFNYKDAIRKTKGIRTLVFLEGLDTITSIILIPLISISFIQKETSYGIFLSIVSLFGVIASFITARNSDKVNERAAYIYPTTILLTLFTIFAALSNSLLLWGLFIGLMTFLTRILAPLYETVVIDTKQSLIDSMHAREIFLNLGRIAGCFIVLTSLLLFDSLRIPMIIITTITLAYPIMLSKKQIYKHSDTISDYFANNTANMSRTFAAQSLLLVPKTIIPKIAPKHNDKLYYNWKYKHKSIR